MCLGVNLLVGTENGLMLLDRSGQGKVYNLITRRRFLQMDVLEGLNVLVTISGQFHRSRQGVGKRTLNAYLPYFSFLPSGCSREEEQAACLLLVVAEKQDITQRPGGGEEAGLDHGWGSGGLCAL